MRSYGIIPYRSRQSCSGQRFRSCHLPRCPARACRPTRTATTGAACARASFSRCTAWLHGLPGAAACPAVAAATCCTRLKSVPVRMARTASSVKGSWRRPPPPLLPPSAASFCVAAGTATASCSAAAAPGPAAGAVQDTLQGPPPASGQAAGGPAAERSPLPLPLAILASRKAVISPCMLPTRCASARSWPSGPEALLPLDRPAARQGDRKSVVISSEGPQPYWGSREDRTRGCHVSS